MADNARDRTKKEQTKFVARNVHFVPDYYGPGAETRPRDDDNAAGRCWRVFVTLPATLELDVDVVVVTPELVVVAPVDAGAAATEGYGWRRVKVLWTPVLPIY